MLQLGKSGVVSFSWVDDTGTSVEAVHETFPDSDGGSLRIGIEFEHRDRERLAASDAVAAVLGYDDGNGIHSFQDRRLSEYRTPAPISRW